MISESMEVISKPEILEALMVVAGAGAAVCATMIGDISEFGLKTEGTPPASQTTKLSMLALRQAIAKYTTVEVQAHLGVEGFKEVKEVLEEKLKEAKL